MSDYVITLFGCSDVCSHDALFSSAEFCSCISVASVASMCSVMPDELREDGRRDVLSDVPDRGYGD
jgi:hypothetical protein